MAENGLADDPLFAQAKARGIKALSGHAESIDVTNDVNGGPSGVGIATAAGKAAFWDMAGAKDTPKIMALEGEFAMTEGHAQELKTQALALKVGKRLRVILSDNNAGIDDVLVGRGDRPEIHRLQHGRPMDVLWLERSAPSRMAAITARSLPRWKTMEAGDPADKRPMIAIAKTTKGYWPAASNGQLTPTVKQVVSYQSHPYGYKMNSDYFVALAGTFEERYGIEFDGIRKGPVTNERERLIQFKTNIDKVMSVLDKNGLGDWLAERLVTLGDAIKDDRDVYFAKEADTFLDDRLQAPPIFRKEPLKVTRLEPSFRRQQGSFDFPVPQAGRSGGRAARHFRDHQMDELCHRQPFRHFGGGLVGIHQCRAWQPVGPLRSGDQSAGHAGQGGDPGSGQCRDRHRPGEPERQRRSRTSSPACGP